MPIRKPVKRTTVSIPKQLHRVLARAARRDNIGVGEFTEDMIKRGLRQRRIPLPGVKKPK